MDILDDINATKCHFNHISDWFNDSFKPSIKNFLINFSKASSKSRKDTVLFLSVALQLAVQEGNWEQAAYARSRLDQMNKEDSFGLVIRSRHNE